MRTKGSHDTSAKNQYPPGNEDSDAYIECSGKCVEWDYGAERSGERAGPILVVT